MNGTVFAKGSWNRFLAVLLMAVLLVPLVPGGLALAAESETAPVAGLAWTARKSGTTATLRDIAVGGNKIVVVGHTGTTLWSTDGDTWNRGSLATPDNLYGVVHGSGGFVAVGDNGAILTSGDGANWVSHQKEDRFDLLTDVAYGNGIYVAVGALGTIMYSYNGSNWVPVPNVTEDTLNAITFGGNQFVAVGANGTILTSPDGDGWYNPNAGTNAYLTGVAYGNGRYMVVGENDTVLISSDGAAWHSKAVPDPGALGLWRVVAGNGYFVGVGGTGAIVSTRDGAEWVEHDLSQVHDFLYAIEHVKGQFVAVGQEGIIRTSLGDKLAIAPPTENIPPDATKACEPGVVSVAPVTKPFFRLEHLAADGERPVAGGVELCGTISLSEYVKVAGTVVMREGDPKLEGRGSVYIEVNSPPVGTLTILQGDFTVDAASRKIHPAGDFRSYSLAGLPIFMQEIEVTDFGLRVPVGYLGIPEDLLEIELDGEGEESLSLKAPIEELAVENGSLGGKFALDRELKIGLLELEEIKIDINPGEGTWMVDGEVEIGPMEFDAMIGWADGGIDAFGVGIETRIPIGTTPFFVTKLKGSVEGIQSGDYTVTAGGDISGVYMVLLQDYLVKAEEIELKVEWKGSFLQSAVSLSGDLKLWILDVARAEAVLSAKEARVTGRVNVLEMIIAEAELGFDAQAGIHGHMKGEVRIPPGVRVVGGLVLAGGGARFSKDDIAVYATRWGLRYGCRVRWGDLGDPECGRNVSVLSSVAYTLPLVAANTGSVGLGANSFVVPSGVRQALILLEWPDGDTDFVLTAPDGKQVTPSTGQYEKQLAVHKAFYVIDNPQSGTWTYGVTNPAITSGTLHVMETTPAPTFSFLAPQADITASGPVSIRWSTDAPAGSKVGLFYNTAGTGYTGSIIAGDLDATSGNYMWDPTGLPDGTYYVYGYVDDGITPVHAYAPAKITVRNLRTPAAPTGLTGRAANGSVELQWNAVSNADLAGYWVYLMGDRQDRRFVEGATRYAWQGLTPGRSYQFAVAAVSREDRESSMSAPIMVNLTAPKPPSLQVNWPAQAVNRAEARVSGQVGPGGTATLYLNGKRVAGSFTGRFDAPLTLVPGMNRLKVVAAAANGDTAQQEANVLLDDIAPELRVSNLQTGATLSAAPFTIRGTVEPGAALVLNGTPVSVQADGSFAAVLRPVTGSTQVELVARDKAGNTKTFRATVTFSDTAAKACGTLFPDVPGSSAACDSIEFLAGRKVIGGYPDGTFQPNRGITRAEFAKMLVVAMGWKPSPAGTLPFADSRGHWASSQGYLQAAVAMKAIGGFPDGTFRPEEPVTRAQIVRIVAAAGGLSADGIPTYSDVDAAAWYAGWVAAAEQAGLVGAASTSAVWSGTTFGGDAPATRAEAAMVLANLIR